MKVDPQAIYNHLRDNDVPHNHAMGILANMRAESGFDAGIQERHPIRGRGGYGLCQWTGPRRRALERFAQQQGKDLWDWQMQLEFLLGEHDTDHYMDKNCKTAEDATTWFLAHWERPAVLNTAARLRYLATLKTQIEVA
jgi:hypothetical protein